MPDRRRTTGQRRRGQRAPFVAAVRQKVGSEVGLALAQNIGPTGIELKRPPGRALLPRTAMSLAFELPDGGPMVSVQGAVVFERAAGSYSTTGVHFETLTPLD